MLSGYPEGNFRRLCDDPAGNRSIDKCPFIFPRFDEAKYLTTFVEDSPTLAAFNYKRIGFVHQPVDFYGRPLFLAALGLDIARPNASQRNDECIGHLTNDEAILNYLESTLDFAHRHSSPLFATSWSTRATHSDMNEGQLTDDTYAQFLRRIEEKGHLDNTILFFLSDHGYRNGPTRETVIGYFEDRLPNMWIRLPPKLRKKYPQWQKALEVNSK